MTRAALAATVSAAFAAGGILALGQPAAAAANARTVTIAMDCAWQTPTGGTAYGPEFAASPAFVLSAPGAAEVGGKADLGATLKDDGNLLVIPPGTTAHNLMYTGAFMDAHVSGADGLAAPKLTTSSDGAAVGADGVVKSGPFTQSYSVTGAGNLTVQLDKLTVSFTDKANGNAALTLVCTPKSESGVWPAIAATSGTPAAPSNGGTLQQTVGVGITATATATATATGTSTAKPTATLTQGVSVAPTTSASTSGTTSGSGSTSSGPLAHTGGGGPGLMALAMLAASLLLGSIAVILALPHRRKSRPLT